MLENYKGMRNFLLLWTGQVGDIVGNGVTRFVFVFFTFRETQSATAVTLVALFAFLPKLLLSPLAGSIVDRLGDRLGLVLSSFVSAIGIGIAFILALQGGLGIGPILAIAAVTGAVEALQYPALSAATAQMVKPEQYVRADGLISAAKSGSDVGGPALAGLLLALPHGLAWALGLDVVLSLVSVVIALLVPIPKRDTGMEAKFSFWKQTTSGVNWILKHPALRRLAGLFLVVNLVGVIGQVIIQPMVLSRTDGDATALSTVLAAIGAGGIAGGLLMASWGGPKNKVRGLLIGILAVSAIGQIAFGVTGTVLLWSIFGFLNGAIVVFINACNQAVWQTTVPKALLGRVFGGFVFIAQITVPFGIAFAGLAADYIFEPWARSGGALALLWSSVAGEGPGAGMSALLALAGAMGVVAAVMGLSSRPLRALQEEHKEETASAMEHLQTTEQEL
ncbi:Major Facilitator Superfamily protein [Brevibacterium antiquum]|uniref:Major Facilitator Superfamily protein n=2 Tax=Brevibacterium antiquum TaxID=234835 RepID=A0A2H1KTB0_9MICO|nr:Major Facilitator Superfamily protein [Brevibacterium antiquum]